MISNLRIEFNNCYGIRHLCHSFIFSSEQRTHIIYAPNGSMKSSFAKTFRFISGQTKNQPMDELHKDVTATHTVMVDENEIAKGCVFVIDGDDEIDSSQCFVNFLASSDLKKRYDTIYSRLNSEKDSLMSRLKGASRSTNCEFEIVSTFSNVNSGSIFSVLDKLREDIRIGNPFYDFKYNDVFDPKGNVQAFIEKHKTQLETYIREYKNLLSQSNLFRVIDGHSFGTYHASQLVQCTSDNAFFGVHHKILLQNGTEITSNEQLENIIDEEQKRIFKDEKLLREFEKITKAIDKNTELRGFKDVIEKHPEWISELLQYEEFKKKVWIGLLSKEDIKPIFDSYLKVYDDNKDELNQVLSEANSQQDIWKNITALYNSRFDVPIKVEIKNQKDIILKQEAAKLQFIYTDNGQEIPLNKNEMYSILSRGEKRAFTILQFLFEIEARKTASNDTLLILDDIADSFDYQNKYAIIEYIKDLSENSPSNHFYSIIMTHNYDFYRTVSSRLNINQDHLWMAERDNFGNINLGKGQYKGNIFAKVFVNHDDNDKYFISMIPFVRNLIEYTKGTNDDDYQTLTNCLHLKNSTKSISEKQVIDIMDSYTLGKGMKRSRSDHSVYDLIITTARNISNDQSLSPILIENKIVLSVAIRLLAEQYLHDCLIRAGETENDLSVHGNQTGKWIDMFKRLCPNDANMSIIERVCMMTPEAIHLNSFMFEPLIDMSVSHLIKLYNDVAALQ